MDYGEGLMYLVGVLVIGIIVVAAVIPGVYTAISGADIVTAVTGETWVGTAATPHALVYNPVKTVTAFKKSGTTSVYDDAGVVGGAGTVDLTLVSYLDTGVTANLTVDSTIVENVTNVSIGTCYLGELTGPSDVWTGINLATCGLTTNPATVTFESDGPGNDVTNVSLSYAAYTDSTAYTLDATPGTITPTASGRYYTSYTYGTSEFVNVNTILALVPLLIAVAFLFIVIVPVL